jgi:hypothetical protein
VTAHDITVKELDTAREATRAAEAATATAVAATAALQLRFDILTDVAATAASAATAAASAATEVAAAAIGRESTLRNDVAAAAAMVAQLRETVDAEIAAKAVSAAEAAALTTTVATLQSEAAMATAAAATEASAAAAREESVRAALAAAEQRIADLQVGSDATTVYSGCRDVLIVYFFVSFVIVLKFNAQLRWRRRSNVLLICRYENVAMCLFVNTHIPTHTHTHVYLYTQLLRLADDEKRRGLHAMVQDLKGAVRVFCRVRPSAATASESTLPFVVRAEKKSVGVPQDILRVEAPSTSE